MNTINKDLLYVFDCVKRIEDACNGIVQAAGRAGDAILCALDERDRWREHAECRWAMRREIESLLGLEPDATFEEANFQEAVERLRKLVENEK